MIWVNVETIAVVVEEEEEKKKRFKLKKMKQEINITFK